MSQGQPLDLKWSEHRGRSCLRVSGWTETELRQMGGLPVAELSRRLALFPSELVHSGADLSATQPIAGRWEVDQDSVCFIPRFPFRDGLGYALLLHQTLDGLGTGHPEVFTIQRPSSEAKPTTEVLTIYPDVDQVPVNLLKFYVHFSSPMSEDRADRAVRMRRADNHQPLEGVFVPMQPELWDRERRRLTLLLDPGRIKRGLAPNQEAGYPLIEGVPIILSVATEFRDAAGQPLSSSVARRYEIGPAVRSRIDPADWSFQPPLAGSMDLLTVEFYRPLDHGLLQHCLWVNDGAGVPLAGQGSVGPGEGSWRFQPQSPWEEGQHQLVVDPRLEDLAGNSLLRVFDRDLTRAEDAPSDVGHFAIDFSCAPTPALFRPRVTG